MRNRGCLISLNDDELRDLQAIIIFALRYSQGRKTYAFDLVTDFILGHAELLQEWQLRQMAEDIINDLSWLDLELWEKQKYRQTADKINKLAEKKLKEESNVR